MSISALKKWITFSILPIVLIFLIINSIIDINTSESNLIKGKVSEIGLSESIYRQKSLRNLSNKKMVFFLKLENDSNKYSYSIKKHLITQKIKKGDYVNIYYEKPQKYQNTISIIQLEKGNQILISKSIHNKRNYFIIIAFLAFLILYVIIIYRKFKNHDKTSYYK
ncbi:MULTISPECIES: hypothetical protein [Empedobacter]|uniref:hypothetical protein n=1 Tax=Empedobacter TaxID=59734 RepID=UPI0025BB7263|nr:MULTISPECIES: hypothetical protein [unclassified Empedobacter]